LLTRVRSRARKTRGWPNAAGALLIAFGSASSALAAEPFQYHAILPMPTGKTVTLTGHDLNFEQIVRVARLGDKVELSPEAVRHEEDAYRLLLEGAAENVPIEGFNRNAGKLVFEGDPALPDNAAAIGRHLLTVFESGAAEPGAAEIADEDVVRAAMVVRANTLIYTAASPPVLQLLVGLLNNRITPVAGKGGILRALGRAMVGQGDAYFGGVRVKAADALAMAGLMPLEPAGMDDRALMDGYEPDLAVAALLAADSRRALDWADLVVAMDLTAANANVAALSASAEANRPFRWMNWDALRLLDMLKGGALFDADPARPDQLPAGLRETLAAQATTWMEWGALRDILAIALNSSSQSPAVRVGLSPRESFELGTPQLAKFVVKGGRANGGKRGYIVDAVNDDPGPLKVAIHAFDEALGRLDQALGARTDRMDVIVNQFVISYGDIRGGEIEVSTASPRAGLAALSRLLGVEFVHEAAAIDRAVRDNPDIKLGAAPAAVMTAWRAAASGSDSDAAFRFMQANPVGTFFPLNDPPGTDDAIPLAQERIRR
jgi:histidine ammonia-lyase